MKSFHCIQWWTMQGKKAQWSSKQSYFCSGSGKHAASIPLLPCFWISFLLQTWACLHRYLPRFAVYPVCHLMVSNLKWLGQSNYLTYPVTVHLEETKSINDVKLLLSSTITSFHLQVISDSKSWQPWVATKKLILNMVEVFSLQLVFPCCVRKCSWAAVLAHL